MSFNGLAIVVKDMLWILMLVIVTLSEFCRLKMILMGCIFCSHGGKYVANSCCPFSAAFHRTSQ